MTSNHADQAPTCAAILVAAGRGVRAGDGLPKQYRPLGGVPVVRRSVDAMAASNAFAAIVPVIHPDDRTLFERALAGGPETAEPVAGGATRQQSVLNGLRALAPSRPDIVLIHDAARPGVDPALIRRVIEGVKGLDGAVPALPVVDTLKRAGHGQIDTTVPRDGLWRVQTPQGFRFDAILEAHERAWTRGDMELTDDAAVAEAAGLTVALVEGSEENLKLTTPGDFARVQRMLTLAQDFETRTGLGFDVHRFSSGSHVTLGGIEIPHERGLAGHSDADVALHALTDALYGAVGAGDVGVHFPPSEPQWKGAPSRVFLEDAMSRVRAHGGELVNADLTLICESPKIGPHRDAMIECIAAIMAVDQARLSVKATTTEGLGFAGRGEGIAAQAVVSIRLPINP